MMKLLGLFFFVAAAVIIGLVIAYWYLRRVDAERPRLHREPRIVPMRDKHRPVDLTPDAKSVDALRDQTDAATSASDADVDGRMRRRNAVGQAKDRAAAEARPARDQPRDQARVRGNDTDGGRDDLKRISGIGPKLERVLNANGISRFRQIAEWQDADIDAIDEQLGAFRGRIRRDDWIGQAKKLTD